MTNPEARPPEPRQPLEPVAGAEPTAGQSWERVLEEGPCWPVTRLAAFAFTLALALAILAPVAIADAPGRDWVLLVVPAGVATMSARALFETLVSAGHSRGVLRHLLCAVVPSLLAVGVIVLAAAIVGTGLAPGVGGITGALVLLTLTAAGSARDVEIRVRLSLRRVFLIGSRASHQDLARELSRRRDASLVGSSAVDGSLQADSLLAAITNARATVLVLNHDAMQSPELVEVARRLNLAGMQIRDLVSYYESEFKKVPLEELSPTWFLFDIVAIHQRVGYRQLRRASELAISGLLLLAAAPVLTLAAAAVKLTSPGPVLYRQRRVGRDNEPFTLTKLRTMTQADGDEASWAGTEVRRITPVGMFLRRFRIDELPQLWSVVSGDMSLIGPRPEQVPIVERLDRELPHYSARHCIRPGITGWAQVNLGYAGSAEGTMAKLQRDLYYVKHASLRLDALILWLTFKTVLSGRG